MRATSRLVLAFLLVSTILVSTIPHQASAIPWKVEGYLKDAEGLPITLGNITIVGMIYDPGIQDYEEVPVYGLTDGSGYYRIYLRAMEPGGYDSGSTVTVSYTSDGKTVSRDVVIEGLSAWANLTYEEETGLLDVLASPIGLVVIVVIVTAVFMIYYVYQTSKRPELDETENPKRVEKRRRR